MIYRCSFFSVHSTLVSWMRGNKLVYTEVQIFFKWVCMVRDYSGLLEIAETPPKAVFLLKRRLRKISDIVSITLNCQLHHFLWLFFFFLLLFVATIYLIRIIWLLKIEKKRRLDGNCPQSFPELFTTFNRKQLRNVFTNIESRIETTLHLFFLWGLLFYFSANCRYPWEKELHYCFLA